MKCINKKRNEFERIWFDSMTKADRTNKADTVPDNALKNESMY